MIQPVETLDLRLIDGDWPIDAATRTRIDGHWQAAVAANPHLWNGKVLGTLAPGMAGGVALSNGCLSGQAVIGNFADFLAWRDWGFPEIGIRNLFGSALILSRDDALLYGEMDATTANAGRIYAPGGSLEPSDADAEGRIDVIASIEREMQEETGLDAGDATVEGTYVAFDGPRISIGRVYRFDRTAADLLAEIEVSLAAQAHRELAAVVALRHPSDLPAGRTMPYAAMFADFLLG